MAEGGARFRHLPPAQDHTESSSLETTRTKLLLAGTSCPSIVAASLLPWLPAYDIIAGSGRTNDADGTAPNNTPDPLVASLFAQWPGGGSPFPSSTASTALSPLITTASINALGVAQAAEQR